MWRVSHFILGYYYYLYLIHLVINWIKKENKILRKTMFAKTKTVIWSLTNRGRKYFLNGFSDVTT